MSFGLSFGTRMCNVLLFNTAINQTASENLDFHPWITLAATLNSPQNTSIPCKKPQTLKQTVKDIKHGRQQQLVSYWTYIAPQELLLKYN